MQAFRFAKLFMKGKSQAVRLPREFRFAGDKVRIRRVGTGVLLEPEIVSVDEWFARMHADGTGFEIDRQQPVAPENKVAFD